MTQRVVLNTRVCLTVSFAKRSCILEKSCLSGCGCDYRSIRAHHKGSRRPAHTCADSAHGHVHWVPENRRRQLPNALGHGRREHRALHAVVDEVRENAVHLWRATKQQPDPDTLPTAVRSTEL